MRDGAEAEAKLTLGQAIGRTASSFPHQPAIVSATFAPLTYRDLQRQLDGRFGLTHRDRCLSVSSPYYSHGLKVTVFTPLLTGGSIAVPANSAVVALDEWLDVLRPIAERETPPALWDGLSIAMAQYLPAPLEVPVTFYAAEHDGRAWRHLSSQLEVIQVPGGHLGCLTIGAELLVDHLRQRIDGLADGAPPSLNRTRRGRMAGLACDDNQGALVRGELDALSPRDDGDLKGPVHQPT